MRQRIWVEAIPQSYSWGTTYGFKIGRVFKRRPKKNVVRSGPIIEVEIELPAVLFDHVVSGTAVMS